MIYTYLYLYNYIFIILFLIYNIFISFNKIIYDLNENQYNIIIFFFLKYISVNILINNK